MLSYICWVLLTLSLILSGTSAAYAVTLTYDFSGIFDTGPLVGQAFSDSFSYDTAGRCGKSDFARALSRKMLFHD
jgi:hypothetical protein